MKKVIFTMICLALSIGGFSQSVSSSTKQVISSKALKGGLRHVEMNEEEIEITYLLKEKKGTAFTETYIFDKETLKFKSSEEREEDLNSAKFSIGEKATRVLRVQPNLLGQIKLQLGRIEYSTGRGAFGGYYTIEHFIKTSEVKPKGDDGDRIVMVMSQTYQSKKNAFTTHYGKTHNVNLGDIQVVGIVNKEPLFTHYESMVYSAKDLSSKNRLKIELPYSYNAIARKILPNGNMAMVLRPYTMKDIPKPEHSAEIIAAYKLSPNFNYRYLEVNASGELVHNFEFEMKEPESGWTLACDIIPGENGAIFISGSMQPLKILGPPLKKIYGARPDYGTEVRSLNCGKKATDFFVTKLQDGKQVYHTEMPWSDLVQKPVSTEQSASAVPEDVASYLKWDHYFGRTALSQGSKDIIAFQKVGDIRQFMQLDGSSGDVEANYFISPDKKQVLSAGSVPELIRNDKGDLYIVTYQQSPAADGSAEKQAKALESQTAFVSKLDPITKTLSKPIDISPDGNTNPYNGYFPDSDNSFLTLATGRKKEIILTRVKLD